MKKQDILNIWKIIFGSMMIAGFLGVIGAEIYFHVREDELDCYEMSRIEAQLRWEHCRGYNQCIEVVSCAWKRM